MVPWDGFRLTYDDEEISEAIELIGKPFHPTDAIKKQTHQIIEELANTGLAGSLFLQGYRGQLSRLRNISTKISL